MKEARQSGRQASCKSVVIEIEIKKIKNKATTTDRDRKVAKIYGHRNNGKKKLVCNFVHYQHFNILSLFGAGKWNEIETKKVSDSKTKIIRRNVVSFFICS